jgi:hypothetical protein
LAQPPKAVLSSVYIFINVSYRAWGRGEGFDSDDTAQWLQVWENEPMNTFNYLCTDQESQTNSDIWEVADPASKKLGFL